MANIIRDLIWFAVVAAAATFAIFVVLGSEVTAHAQDPGPAVFHDVISPGAHQLSGIVLVPYACDELTVQPEKIAGAEYELVFTTWKDPSIACPETPTARGFETVLFAPSLGITIIAALDSQAMPVRLVTELSTSTPI